MPRFDYDRMKGDDLQTALTELGMQSFTFARIFGVRSPVVKRWLRDEQTIPAWVYVALRLLALPHGQSEARSAAAEHIIRDNKYPSRGEYPFLTASDFITEGSDDDDD